MNVPEESARIAKGIVSLVKKVVNMGLKTISILKSDSSLLNGL